MRLLTDFIRGSALFQGIFLNQALPPIEKWALSNAGRCNADDIIIAALVHSFAKDFPDWTSISTAAFSSHDFNHAVEKLPTLMKLHVGEYATVVFFNRKKELVFCYRKEDKYLGSGKRKTIRNHFRVNGIEIPNLAGELIVRHYNRLEDKEDAVKRTAAKAEADMKRNEAAWNLAERLLGMKRNEHGALVPINKPEEAEKKPRRPKLVNMAV